MPIYEYRCDNCGHEMETIQKISENPMKTCPECNQDALVKKISAAGFRLKGGGWYETDFKSKSDKKRNLGGSSESSGSSSESGSSSTKETSSSKDSSSSSSTQASKKSGDTA